MSDSFITGRLSYCRRCGHYSLVGSTDRALKTLGVCSRDVVVVTDIGCQGMIDKNLTTHTIHGLHGRSVALGAGLAMGLSPGKKVIVFIGDGGATIGLQHLLEAARLNVDLTVVVHNNMLYGMTGGQPSGLTPRGYVTKITPAPEGSKLDPYDLCQLVYSACASYVRRVTSEEKANLVEALRTALETEGFALVEVLEWCTGRKGEKSVVELKEELQEWARQSGWGLNSWRREEERSPFSLDWEDKPSLLEKAERLEACFESRVKQQTTVIMGGKAGRRIRSTATYFSQGAVLSGLQVTQRNDYPVTVKAGHSVSEAILSPNDISYMGIAKPDIMVVLFKDCLKNLKSRLEQLTREDTLYIHADLLDGSYLPKELCARKIPLDFSRAGTFSGKTGYWAVMAMAEVLRHSQLYDLEAFKDAVSLRREYAEENLAAIEASKGLAVSM